MLQRFPILCAMALAALIAGCSTGRPKERINPPDVSVQEFRIDGEQQCTLLLRIQNHSTVTMRYSVLNLERLTVDGRELGPLALTPDIDVPPYTGEPVTHPVACPGMTANASELVYRLSGRIEAVEPGKRGFDVHHRSRLLPVPGLGGVYR